MTAVLPRSLDPLPDESISGYALRLAYRLSISPSRLNVITGLYRRNGRDRQALAPTKLLINVTPEQRKEFAAATRLSDEEVASLFLSGYAERYPAAALRKSSESYIGGARRALYDQWLFTGFSRFCPLCLQGNGSELQSRYGGAWRRLWRLPVAFSCPEHSTYLSWHCADGHIAHRKQNNHLPRGADNDLHPLQCRETMDPTKNKRHTSQQPCKNLYTGIAPPATRPSAAALSTQKRILCALDPRNDGRVVVLGHRTQAAQYFTDLFELCALIRQTWPVAQAWIPDTFLADSLARHLEEAKYRIQKRSAKDGVHYGRSLQMEHRTPPASPEACAGLLTAADRLLSLPSPSDLTPHLRLMLPDRRRISTSRWADNFINNMPDSTESFRRALTPVLQPRAKIQKHGGNRISTPIRRFSFASEFIPQALQDDWYHTFFSGFEGLNPFILRRVGAIKLCQLVTGSSVRESAIALGVPNTPRALERCQSSFKLFRQWCRDQVAPEDFDSAVDTLADHVAGMADRVDYGRRRSALQGWCIDPRDWAAIAREVPPRNCPGRPHDLSDLKRQAASMVVWSRLTGGEHVFAPRPITGSLPADEQKRVRNRQNTICCRLLQGPTRGVDVALDGLLRKFADRLVAEIDAART